EPRQEELPARTSSSSGSAIIRICAKNSFAIRQGHGSSVHMIRSVFGEESVDSHGVAVLQRILAPALAAQTVWRTAFNCIIRHLAGCVFHIDVVIDVRIHPFDFGNSASRSEERRVGTELCCR